MKKPAALRAHLLAACPVLEQNPDRLLVFVDKGHIAATYAPSLSFQYQYELEMIVTDFVGGPEAIMVPLLQWLTRHQPELLANPATRGQIGFEADVLAGDLVDLSLKLTLSERVVLTRGDNGALVLEFPPEPLFDDGHGDILRGGDIAIDGVVVGQLPAMNE
ncbi:phage tail protein [Stenotrophomonas sp. Iso1]|uniref:phage tail protein n=1 Tax=Stenotrophomonas sp. Iso1 TaxID=2977283 RepID=UPI0022B7B474|nr:phage tail protein [Stenotrophomonas sp. Iso1]